MVMDPNMIQNFMQQMQQSQGEEMLRFCQPMQMQAFGEQQAQFFRPAKLLPSQLSAPFLYLCLSDVLM